MLWKYKHVVLVVLFIVLSVQIGSIIASATTNDQRFNSGSNQAASSSPTGLAAADSDNKNGSEPKSAASKNVTQSNAETSPQKETTSSQSDTAGSSETFPTAVRDSLPAAGTWQSDFKTVDNTNVLGIAGQFTIFSREIDANANHPIKGNFATQFLATSDQNQNGSDGISYIQKLSVIPGVYTNFGGNKLILGQDLTYTKNFKDGKPGINQIKLERSPQNGYSQDKSGSRYIDIDSEFGRLTNNSKKIADYSKNNRPIVTNYYGAITLDTSKITATNHVKYLVLKPSDIHDNERISITGLASDETVVITFDTSGISRVAFQNLSFYNGTENKSILFNYYNLASETAYQGDITWGTQQSSGPIYAILAPQATLTLAHISFQGNIIAKKFVSQYMGNQNGNFSDIPVPTDKPPIKPKSLLSVPNLIFGKAILHSKDTPMGDWDGTFALQASKGDNVRINVSLVAPFTNAAGVKANQVSWQLLHSNYQNGQVVTTSQNISNSSAQISYWVWQDNGQGNLLQDWQYNEGNKINDFYKINIGNLASVTDTGDYTAKLRWTIVDAPS